MSMTVFELRRRWQRRRCTEMAVEFMEDVLANTPYDWQKEVIGHMALMPVPHSGVDCAPILLVRPTGGGKPSV